MFRSRSEMKFEEVTTQDKAAILNFNCEHSIIVPYQKK